MTIADPQNWIALFSLLVVSLRNAYRVAAKWCFASASSSA